MSNAALKLQEKDAQVTLTPTQIEGLGKVGDAANQITELLKLAQTALDSIGDTVDIGEFAENVGGQIEALIDTLKEISEFFGIHSAEDLKNSLDATLNSLEAAKIQETTPELINLLGALHTSGLLKVLPPLLQQIGELTTDIDAESLGQRLSSLNVNLRYWMDTAREGARIIGEQVIAMDIPDKVAVLEDIADQWWHIAMRAKNLAQGDAETLGERVEWVLDQAEYWGAQLGVVFATLSDTAPEIWKELDFSTIGAKIREGAVGWYEIGILAAEIIKGDSGNLKGRIREMLQGAHDAGLDKMIPELITMLGTVNRTGLLRKVNTVLTTLEPHIPEDEELKAWIEQGAVLAKRYQPQIAGALPALDATFKVMEGTEQKSGGLFGLLGIVFSSKTQYLLRFVIEFAYRFLRGNKD